MTTTAYHGGPITPYDVFDLVVDGGQRALCVSFYTPYQIEMAARDSSELMIDCGSFAAWTANMKVGAQTIIFDQAYWLAYYAFSAKWVRRPQDWCVIPDVIDAGSQEQDALLREWPAELARCGVPVWHMDEPVARLLRLIDTYGRVCIGSTAEYRVVGSPEWRERMDEVWNAIWTMFGAIPDVHMFRGLQCLLPSYDYPFRRVDSTNIARNHNRMKKHGSRSAWAIRQQIDGWDRRNCPEVWPPDRLKQTSLITP